MRRASFGVVAYVYGFLLLLAGAGLFAAWTRGRADVLFIFAIASAILLRRLADRHADAHEEP